MSYNTLGEGIEDVARNIDKYAMPNQDRDSSNRKLIRSEIIQTTKGIMRRVHSETGLVPRPVPTSKGGIRLEYSIKNIDDGIEIEIYPDGKTIGTFLTDDTEHEGITIDTFLGNIRKYMGLRKSDEPVY